MKALYQQIVWWFKGGRYDAALEELCQNSKKTTPRVHAASA